MMDHNENLKVLLIFLHKNTLEMIDKAPQF